MSALSRGHRPMHDVFNFWKAWVRRPARLGAVAPSGRSLALAMACEIPRGIEGPVVELGGGTGAITAALLHAVVRPKDLIVIEREPALCDIIEERFPGVRVICGDARDLALLLQRDGVGPVRAVVSGLPLVLMSPEARRTIIAQAFAVMPAEGVFVQFTYSPVSPLPRHSARALGIEGRRAEWVLDNLPPAAVWRYRRRPSAAAAKPRSTLGRHQAAGPPPQERLTA